MIKFTRDDFEYFRRECKWWIDRFGLTEWDVGFAFKMPDDHQDAMAATSANFEGRSAIIYMAPELDGDEEEAYAKYELIRESARHEALELLLMPMQMLACEREFNREQFNSEVHSCIHRMERAIDQCDRDILREALNIKRNRKGRDI